MDRGSAKHGPRVDDTLDREVHDLVDADPGNPSGPGIEEAPAEDEPSIGRRPVVRDDGMAPSEDAIALRSEIARFVRPHSFPATGAVLHADATSLGAGPDVLMWFAALPEGRIYDNVEAVWADIGGEGLTRGV